MRSKQVLSVDGASARTSLWWCNVGGAGPEEGRNKGMRTGIEEEGQVRTTKDFCERRRLKCLRVGC